MNHDVNHLSYYQILSGPFLHFPWLLLEKKRKEKGKENQAGAYLFMYNFPTICRWKKSQRDMVEKVVLDNEGVVTLNNAQLCFEVRVIVTIQLSFVQR